MPELSTKIIDLFFKDTNKGESEQDKVDEQIKVVNIDDKNQSIMDNHSTMQQNDTENKE
ncbi:19248_t:CDS:2 [Gigaspora margarita]|uniref:19248_t:CDS:1 n=1 Tax=Gigaspora margarita TaxID=4874 RepID=A0ABN7V3U1_GIGMA|nr:19248_t:CDS:2 [Gigaspora margarita]